jgi:lipopolysaccharide transport system ATP-binding protein
MKPILEIQNVSKKFRIQHEVQPYLSLRDSVMSVFNKKKHNSEEFYALKEVNFNVFSGESIGLIGKNGAGKSTLLKILSKITPPSAGKIVSRGRIASLLEVGTGFHPELSGRENIFLNGSILGMKREEIRKNFNAIVDFSGVEKFIDTPLKHYSSGMQLRLAFAVAAFLENEILIIDEVLAVGDAEFQKKCMLKMEDISHNHGRTILFVSHNLNVINSLCTKALLLKDGMIKKSGITEDVVNYYLSNENENVSSLVWDKDTAPGDEEALIRSAKIIDEKGQEVRSIDISQKIGVEFIYEVIKPGKAKIPNLHLYTIKGDCVFVSAEHEDMKLTKQGVYKTVVWIPGNTLNVEVYSLSIALSTMTPVKTHFWVKDALILETTENMNNRVNSYNQTIPGIIRPELRWETELITTG